MSDAVTSSDSNSPGLTKGNPFSVRTVIFMVLIGFVGFFGLLYAIGAGDSLGNTDNGQAHGASNSLVGYKALAEILKADGRTVTYGRSAANYDDTGLLVVTPGFSAEPETLEELVEQRRYIGPTLIILPKWSTGPKASLKKGWVSLTGPNLSEFSGRQINTLSDNKITVAQKNDEAAVPTRFGLPLNGIESRVSIKGEKLRPVIIDPKGQGALVSLYDNGGYFSELVNEGSREPDDDAYDAFPVAIVAEPDLFNNLGLSDKARARHAVTLIDEISYGQADEVTFDLVAVGLGQSDNLLTLAFRPPFLSATICLIVAALAAAWMAFNRFGPPLREARAIDYGKAALVGNSAAFVKRLNREYLLAQPYAELIRDKAAAAVGLSGGLTDEEVEARLDNLGSYDGKTFSQLAWELRSATKANDITASAATLYRWKKEVIG